MKLQKQFLQGVGYKRTYLIFLVIILFSGFVFPQTGSLDTGFGTVLWNDVDNIGQKVTNGTYIYRIVARQLSNRKNKLLAEMRNHFLLESFRLILLKKQSSVLQIKYRNSIIAVF